MLNPHTGHVSPQFHVKFDDFFETVQDMTTDLDAPEPVWKYLSSFAVQKGPSKTGVKGVLDGYNMPQPYNTPVQPAEPQQDLQIPMEAGENIEKPSTTASASPSASATVASAAARTTTASGAPDVQQ